MKNSAANKVLDFRLVLLATLCLLGLVVEGGQAQILAPARLLLGFACVFYLPGYCLAAALFPQQKDLDAIERAGLCLGLSVAWAPVLALILEYLPWGLGLWPVLLGESASMVVFASVGLARRARLLNGETTRPTLVWQAAQKWKLLSNVGKRNPIGLLAVLLVAGFLATLAFRLPAPAGCQTEFYLLGTGSLAEDFPRQASIGQEMGLTLGLANLEQGWRSYHAEVWVRETWGASRRQQVAGIGPISLAAGERRELPISWSMPWSGQDMQVEFLLFSGAEPGPIRRLLLFVDVQPPVPALEARVGPSLRQLLHDHQR